MANSSEVAAGQDGDYTQYNNLRKDILDLTTGHTHDETDSRALANGIIGQANLGYTAGDNLIISSDTSKNVTDAAYTLQKEIRVVRTGTLTVKFTLTSPAGGTIIIGKIYKNGEAVGTERSAENISTEFTENIGSISPDDLIQIYAYRSAGADTPTLTNFRLYNEYYINEAVILD